MTRIAPERELTARVSLTGPGGLFNRDAVGWSRQPLHDTSGIDGRRVWGRTTAGDVTVPRPL